MNTIITILAIVALVIVIIIAISGSRNLHNFHNGMDETFDRAWKDAGEYAKHLRQNENGNANSEGKLSSN